MFEDAGEGICGLDATSSKLICQQLQVQLNHAVKFGGEGLAGRCHIYFEKADHDWVSRQTVQDELLLLMCVLDAFPNLRWWGWIASIRDCFHDVVWVQHEHVVELLDQGGPRRKGRSIDRIEMNIESIESQKRKMPLLKQLSQTSQGSFESDSDSKESRNVRLNSFKSGIFHFCHFWAN